MDDDYIEREIVGKKEKGAKILFEGKWLVVKNLDGYEYVSNTKRQNGFSAIIPYAIEDGEIFLYVHNELRVPRGFVDRLHPSCVTGSIEEGESHFENAVKELGEEIGFYDVPEERWEFVGEFWCNKKTDDVGYSYLVDVTGLVQAEPSGDGSKGEEFAEPMKILLSNADVVKDAIFHAILSKADWR